MTTTLDPLQLEALFNPRDHGNLVEIASRLVESPRFDPTVRDYGLDESLFALVEGLQWFAQSIRSGGWTYFALTSPGRQKRMLDVLWRIGPAGFAAAYESGMANWRNPERQRDIDRWVQESEDASSDWLWSLALRGRREIMALIG